MKILSYNVNGIRAAQRKGFNQWLAQARPEVLLLQETKAQPDQIDEKAFRDLGYHCYWHSAQKKGYSGVGILSLDEPQAVTVGTGIEYIDSEGRVLRADFTGLSVMSLYLPSGSSGDERQALKMRFLADFEHYATKLKQAHPNLVIGGDFNICHTEIDIHNPKQNQQTSGFLPEERAWMTQFLSRGFIDSFRHLNPGLKDQYSWWSYRAQARQRNKGWRIDYQMVSDALADRIAGVQILPEAKHSDHCPVGLRLAL